MKKYQKLSSSDLLKDTIAQAMVDMKAEKIVIINLKEISNSISDFFVVCSGTSETHINAIGKNIEKEVQKQIKDSPWQTEGKTNKEWILLDYADVVVHVFQKEKRDFYALEELWGDAKIIELEELELNK